jgi:hypothetical protein
MLTGRKKLVLGIYIRRDLLESGLIESERPLGFKLSGGLPGGSPAAAGVDLFLTAFQIGLQFAHGPAAA